MDDAVMQTIVENRGTFSVVPWIDGVGRLLFVQLIFPASGDPDAHTVDHIPDLLQNTPLLVQRSAKGMQTGGTLAEAVQVLRVQFDKIHRDDGDGLEGQRIMWMTDGHSSRFDESVNKANLDNNCRVLIRLANSSAVTQMLDQVFMHFHNAYCKGVKVLEDQHKLKRKSDSDAFVMTKKLVVIVVSFLHMGGNCSWAPSWIFIGAWARVGFGLDGMDVELLLRNTKVRRAGGSTAAASATPNRSISTVFKNTGNLKEGTVAYFKAAYEFSQAQMKELYALPPVLEEIITQCKSSDATPEEQALYAICRADMERSPCQARITTGAKPKRKWNQVTSLIDMNQEMIGQRNDAAKKSKQKKASAVANKMKLRGLATKWAQCKHHCACASGARNPSKCVFLEYFYCEVCDAEGRSYIKKKKCDRRDCLDITAGVQPPPAPPLEPANDLPGPPLAAPPAASPAPAPHAAMLAGPAPAQAYGGY